jgi:hypothetical protein
MSSANAESVTMHREFDRRQLLIGLLSALFVVTSGCATFRRTSELEAAAEELEELLSTLRAANETELLALAEKIKEQSLELQQAHIEFAESFNEAAADRATSDAALLTLVADYEARRKRSRRKLLDAQDELHAMIPDDAWPDVLAVLNTKAQVVASQAGARS